MRPNKYRVFDKVYKTMHVVGTDSHDKLNCFSDGTVEYENLQNGEGSGKHGDYVLMQFTGARDKNEVDIYEKDLAKDDSGEIYEVRYTDFCAFRLYSVKNKENFITMYPGVSVEVIGDVFRNPELLRGVNNAN